MPHMALNHMTVAKLTFREFVALASRLGCVGIEARNDLPQPLFDGMDPAEAGALVRDAGLRLLALAEVKQFNNWSDTKAREAEALMRIASAAGAECVSLIPRNDAQRMGNGERQANLRLAMRELGPMLDEHGLIGLIEPLGFETCPTRFKSEVVDAIEALAAGGRFRIVHDTFHHCISGEPDLFASYTGMVHVSGVVAEGLDVRDMTDGHRILVDARDRLGNIDQLRALIADGYSGPISFEAFAAEVHDLVDPFTALATSTEFIRSHLAAEAA